MNMRGRFGMRMATFALLANVAATCAAFSFATLPMPETNGNPAAVAIVDVDGDARNDLLVATDHSFGTDSSFKMFYFRQLSDGSLATPEKVSHYGAYGRRTGLVAGDVDGDGHADAFIAGNAVGVHRCGLEYGVFGCNAQPVVAGTYAALALVDFDEDGKLDLLGGDCDGVVSVVSDIGSVIGTAATPATLAMPAGPCGGIVVRDMNGDGRSDIATFALDDPEAAFSVRFRLANGTFSAPITRGVPGTPAFSGSYGAVLDIGNDGLADFVTSGGGNSPVNLYLFRQTSAGVIAAGVPFPTYDIPETTKAADLDFDGREDLVVLHRGWLQASVYMGAAAGLADEVRYPVEYGNGGIDALALGDIDGDGCTDAVMADGGLHALRGSGCNLPLFRDGFE